MSHQQLHSFLPLARMQLALVTGTCATPMLMPAIRARPLHMFACVRVGEASNPGPPREDPLVQG